MDPKLQCLEPCWYPVLPVLSRTTEPRAVMLLGRPLVRWRREDGQLGALDDRCRHRSASLAGGRIGARHLRAIYPFGQPTGWHWHDMTAHINIVLRGWIRFRYAGVPQDVTVSAGECLSQPAGVPHNVVGRSDDLELIEINMPADYATVDLGGPLDAAQPPP